MNNSLLNSCYLGWIITLYCGKTFLSPQFLQFFKLQRLRRRANLNRDHSLKNPRTFHLSYLRVDECSWKKIDQVSSAATDHCTSTAVSSARKARTSTRSFCFALFKYKYNIHLAFVNIGWYLARDMALAKYQPIFTRARWTLLTYLAYIVHIRSSSFLLTLFFSRSPQRILFERYFSTDVLALLHLLFAWVRCCKDRL